MNKEKFNLKKVCMKIISDRRLIWFIIFNWGIILGNESSVALWRQLLGHSIVLSMALIISDQLFKVIESKYYKCWGCDKIRRKTQQK